MEFLSDFRVIIAVVAGCTGLYLIFRNKALISRKLQVDFGLSSHLRKHLPKHQRKLPISLVAIGVPKPKGNERLVFTIPCIIENNGPHSLNKVTLQFEYPHGFEPPSQDEIGEKFAKTIRVIREKEYSPPYTVQGYLQTRRDFDLVRPGEHLGQGEPLSIKPFHASVSEDTPVGRQVHILSKLLAKKEPIVSVFPMRLFVFSQELQKKQLDVLVIWVKSESLEELSKKLDQIAKRLWKMSFGDSRFLIKYPWEKLENTHLALLMQPKYLSSDDGRTRLMDGNLKLDQMSVGEVRLPHNRPYGDLHQF
jgi:hypothetical protein